MPLLSIFTTLALGVVLTALLPIVPTVSSFDIIVVGSGVGGLATAARLASSSEANVRVLEKNAQVGGRCGSFNVHVPEHGIFRHERGPSLLLLKDIYLQLFEECGQKKAQDYGLEIQQCIPAYQMVFDDGDAVELGFPAHAVIAKEDMAARQKASREKLNSYEINGAEKWDEYLEIMSAYLDCGLPNFIQERLDLPSFPRFIYYALNNFGNAWPLKPHSQVLDALFESTKMKALASFQNLYVGLEPYENSRQLGGGILRKTAPAVFGLLAAIELHPSNDKAGVFFAPGGGFQKVTNAIQQLAIDVGVTIECNTTVTNIIGDKGVHVERSGGKQEFLSADLVICNADLPYATQSLFQNDNGDDPYSQVYDYDDSFDYSSGIVSFHWSLNCTVDKLLTHNVFLAGATTKEEAQASWRVLRDTPDNDSSQSVLEPFNFYVHRASHSDPTAAPPGCDSIMVLVPCPTLEYQSECSHLPRKEALRRYEQQFPSSRIEDIRRAVLKRLQAVDLEQSTIIHEVVDTPVTWARDYHAAAGTPFALSHGLSQLSLTRPSANHNVGKSSSKAWFVGASSRPGNGVPLVLMGAKLVADRILQRIPL